MANPSRTPLLLHLHLLRHPSRRATASYTSSLAAPPLDVELLHHVLSPSPLAWLGEALLVEIYIINATTTVVVPRSI